MTASMPVQRGTPDPLGAEFGDLAPVANTILELIASRPNHGWTADEIIDAASASVVDVMMVLARLTVIGRLAHDGLGSGYRTAGTAQVRRAG